MRVLKTLVCRTCINQFSVHPPCIAKALFKLVVNPKPLVLKKLTLNLAGRSV